MTEWRDIGSAPRDGSEFIAWCMRKDAFAPYPTYFMDFAHWSGKTPHDRIGHFASRSGDIVVAWIPKPKDGPKW